MRGRIANIQKIPIRKNRKWDVVELHKDVARRDKYQKVMDLKLKQKTEGQLEIDSVQKRWEHLERAIKATAEEIVGEKNIK